MSDIKNSDTPTNGINYNDYTDVSGKRILNCNSSTGLNEYYVSADNAVNAVGGVISIPFLISSVTSTGLTAIIFGCVALGLKYTGTNKPTSGGIIFLVIMFFLCFLSMIGSIIQMILTVNKIKNTGERPCYSTKQNKVIEK